MRKIVSLNVDELILTNAALERLLGESTNVIENRALSRLSNKIKNHLESIKLEEGE